MSHFHFPLKALSVRQPWAWAIIHGGKDIENRSRFAIAKAGFHARAICIHASLGMTRDEYMRVSDFMWGLGVKCPEPAELLRGGIIGTVRVTDIVKEHPSPWFFGPRGLVLANATPCDFIGATGALGYFDWKANGLEPDPAKRWMAAEAAEAPEDPETPRLL